MFLYDVIKALEAKKVKYAIVGGYALALHGIVRATMDVDLVVVLTKSQLILVEEAMTELGLTSQLPLSASEVYQFRQEYIKNRNMMAWSFVDYNNPSRVVDVLITHNLKNIRVEKKNVSGQKISVVSLKDLLKMKENTGRAKDQLDVESIKRFLK